MNYQQNEIAVRDYYYTTALPGQLLLLRNSKTDNHYDPLLAVDVMVNEKEVDG